ncbi:unnamed protein product, partial [Mesocestoides corti]
LADELKAQGALKHPILSDSVKFAISDDGEASEVGEAEDLYAVPVVTLFYERCKSQFTDIKMVSPDWVVDCIKAQELLDCEKYDVELLIKPTPPKPPIMPKSIAAPIQLIEQSQPKQLTPNLPQQLGGIGTSVPTISSSLDGASSSLASRIISTNAGTFINYLSVLSFLFIGLIGFAPGNVPIVSQPQVTAAFHHQQIHHPPEPKPTKSSGKSKANKHPSEQGLNEEQKHAIVMQNVKNILSQQANWNKDNSQNRCDTGQMPGTFLPTGSTPIPTGGAQRKPKSPKSPGNRAANQAGGIGGGGSVSKAGAGSQKSPKGSMKKTELAEIAVAPAASLSQQPQQQQFTTVTVDAASGAAPLFPHSTAATVLVATANPGVPQMNTGSRVPSVAQQTGGAPQTPAFLLQQQQQQYQQQALLAAQSECVALLSALTQRLIFPVITCDIFKHLGQFQKNRTASVCTPQQVQVSPVLLQGTQPTGGQARTATFIVRAPSAPDIQMAQSATTAESVQALLEGSSGKEGTITQGVTTTAAQQVLLQQGQPSQQQNLIQLQQQQQQHNRVPSPTGGGLLSSVFIQGRQPQSQQYKQPSGQIQMQVSGLQQPQQTIRPQRAAQGMKQTLPQGQQGQQQQYAQLAQQVKANHQPQQHSHQLGHQQIIIQTSSGVQQVVTAQDLGNAQYIGTGGAQMRAVANSGAVQCASPRPPLGSPTYTQAQVMTGNGSAPSIVYHSTATPAGGISADAMSACVTQQERVTYVASVQQQQQQQTQTVGGRLQQAVVQGQQVPQQQQQTLISVTGPRPRPGGTGGQPSIIQTQQAMAIQQGQFYGQPQAQTQQQQRIIVQSPHAPGSIQQITPPQQHCMVSQSEFALINCQLQSQFQQQLPQGGNFLQQQQRQMIPQSQSHQLPSGHQPQSSRATVAQLVAGARGPAATASQICQMMAAAAVKQRHMVPPAPQYRGVVAPTRAPDSTAGGYVQTTVRAQQPAIAGTQVATQPAPPPPPVFQPPAFRGHVGYPCPTSAQDCLIGCVMLLLGYHSFGEAQKTLWKKIIRSYGAEVVPTYDPARVTHVIVDWQLEEPDLIKQVSLLETFEEPLPVTKLERLLCSSKVEESPSPANTTSTEIPITDDSASPCPSPTILVPPAIKDKILDFYRSSKKPSPVRRSDVGLPLRHEPPAPVYRSNQEVVWRFLVRDFHGRMGQTPDRRLVATLRRYEGVRAKWVACYQENCPRVPCHFFYLHARSWDQLRWVALRDRKRLVTIYWVNDVLAKGRLVPPYEILHLPSPFSPEITFSFIRSQVSATLRTTHECRPNYSPDQPLTARTVYELAVISITGFEGIERQKVELLIKQLGASFTDYLDQMNTLLICKRSLMRQPCPISLLNRPHGKKYEMASLWGIPCVNVRWLQDLYLGDLSAISADLAHKYLCFDAMDVTIALEMRTPRAQELMVGWQQGICVTSESWEHLKKLRSELRQEDREEEEEAAARKNLQKEDSEDNDADKENRYAAAQLNWTFLSCVLLALLFPLKLSGLEAFFTRLQQSRHISLIVGRISLSLTAEEVELAKTGMLRETLLRQECERAAAHRTAVAAAAALQAPAPQHSTAAAYPAVFAPPAAPQYSNPTPALNHQLQTSTLALPPSVSSTTPVPPAPTPPPHTATAQEESSAPTVQSGSDFHHFKRQHSPPNPDGRTSPPRKRLAQGRPPNSVPPPLPDFTVEEARRPLSAGPLSTENAKDPETKPSLVHVSLSSSQPEEASPNPTKHNVPPLPPSQTPQPTPPFDPPPAPPPKPDIAVDLEVRLVFTGMDTEARLGLLQLLAQMPKTGIAPYRLVENVSEATHVITDRLVRTPKIYMAVAFGCAIVTPKWVRACLVRGDWLGMWALSESDWLLRDSEAEENLGICLAESLRISHERRLLGEPGLFSDLEFWFAPKAYHREVCEQLVRACGGRVRERRPTQKMALLPIPRQIIICHEEEAHVASYLMRTKTGNRAVHHEEFILSGVLRQQLDFDSYQIQYVSSQFAELQAAISVACTNLAASGPPPRLPAPQEVPVPVHMRPPPPPPPPPPPAPSCVLLVSGAENQQSPVMYYISSGSTISSAPRTVSSCAAAGHEEPLTLHLPEGVSAVVVTGGESGGGGVVEEGLNAARVAAADAHVVASATAALTTTTTNNPAVIGDNEAPHIAATPVRTQVTPEPRHPPPPVDVS